MKRAAEKKAKLAQEGAKPQNTDNLTDAQQRQVKQANARRENVTSGDTGQTSERQDS